MRDTFNYDQHADLHDTDILENPSGTNLWLRQRKEQKIFSFIHVLTKALDASSAPGLTFPQNLGSPQVESQPVGSFTSSMLDIAGERGGVGDEKVVGEHCGSQDTSGEHQHAQAELSQATQDKPAYTGGVRGNCVQSQIWFRRVRKKSERKDNQPTEQQRPTKNT